MNITSNKMLMILSTIVLVMGLLYACPDAEDTAPALKADDITYDKDRIAQGIVDTATPSSATITDFSILKFSIAPISPYVGTETHEPPAISKDGIISTTTTTSAGSYRVTITPDGSTFSGVITVNFYVTIKANDINDLDTKLKQAVTDYGLTGDFNYIDTSDVTTMSYLFRSGYTPGTGAEDSTRTYITDFNGDISKWDVSAVTDFSYMFRGAAAFSQDLSSWRVDSTDTMFSMFKHSGVVSLPDWYIPTSLKADITYDKDSIAQGTEGTITLSSTLPNFLDLIFSVASINTYAGTETKVLPTISEGGIITTTTTTSAGSYRAIITPDENTFTGDPLTVDFYVTIKANDIGALDTMLEQAITDYGLTGDFNYIDTSAVTTMSYLFIHGFIPGTDKAADGTRTYIVGFNGDISKWDVSSVTDFRYMFHQSVFNQDIGDWNVSAGESFKAMFSQAAAFNQDIGRWNVKKGKDFSIMFSEAPVFNQDISKWTVTDGTNFALMFWKAAAFDQNLSEWKVDSTDIIGDMFRGSGMTTLPSWYQP